MVEYQVDDDAGIAAIGGFKPLPGLYYQRVGIGKGVDLPVKMDAVYLVG